ncbi:MAG: hypothetical protein QOD77_308 [Thermoplasmata archaeon]|nr:hypothetical protein [Thermoplasmata archaeon]
MVVGLSRRVCSVVLLALAFLAMDVQSVATVPPAVPVSAGSPCPAAAPQVAFDVTALAVPISYNHWGDFDPDGQLFVLDANRVPLLRDVAGKAAAAGWDAAADGLGELAGLMAAPTELGATIAAKVAEAQARIAQRIDPRPARDVALEAGGFAGRLEVSALAEPLVLRARLGDCVTIRLTNLLAEPAGIDVRGLAGPPGQLAFVLPGMRGAFTFHLPREAGHEGAHFLYSPADARSQTRHGLFGALVGEPTDAAWTGPDGAAGTAGAQAMVVRSRRSDFREAVVFYHDEAGLLDYLGRPLPLLSEVSGEYGPGMKGMNLRSEPFRDRFLFADAELGGHDKSLAYSSYFNGDPGTFMPRAYVGDPFKFRVVNAGPGQDHVHHLHGGGDRWRASPLADDTQFDDGLLKHNHHVRSASERVDVQTLAPGESMTAEVEGGAGGVQQSVGDFLFHCHIVEHYMAGMWSIWRVHNTLQPGLAELPDRRHGTPAAVDSRGLLGRTMLDGTLLDTTTIHAWIEARLPPQGVPGPDDASRWDWTWSDPAAPLYLGEPPSNRTSPNRPANGVDRPALRFNPVDGRLSYPFLEPHLGKRPPFAPDHSPAPHLGTTFDAGHPDGLCPAGAPIRTYNVVAMPAVVPLSELRKDVNGQVFVLAQDRDAVRNGTKAPESLMIRANQGDCIDVLLANELPASKVNMHTHLVQFDVQGSDGVITGMNYEQSIRPATTGPALAAAAPAGQDWFEATDASLFAGATIGVGLATDHPEVRRVVAVNGTTVHLDAPLASAHAAGEWAGTEFARYRWYADVELGIVYWHDHVDGLNSWRHGLYGSLVVEPAGSQWCDPKRPASASQDCAGWEVDEGPIVDIVNEDPARAADGAYTYRELALQFQDRSCAFPVECTVTTGGFPVLPNRGFEPATFNLRTEPFFERRWDATLATGGTRPFPAIPQGDPATPLLEAHAGDPTMVRLVYTGQSMTRGVATFALPGHRFPVEQHLPGSPLVDRVTIGISSQHNMRLQCGAGGCGGQAGDYLYHIADPEIFDRGAWGILRVLPAGNGSVAPLPSNAPPAAIPAGPVRHYDVVSMEQAVSLNDRQALSAPLRFFALASEAPAILAGKRPEPLVLRALPGETVEVTLTNNLGVAVSLHASGLTPATHADLGISVGTTTGKVAAPGATQTYRWVADLQGTHYLTSYGQQQTSLQQPANPATQGLHGSIVVEPPGARPSNWTGAAAVVSLPRGRTLHELVLHYASNDPHYDASAMAYDPMPLGDVMVNYRTEPFPGRVGLSRGRTTILGPLGLLASDATLHVHPCTLDRNLADCGFGLTQAEARNPLIPFARAGPPPETPTLEVPAGAEFVLRIVGAAGDQHIGHDLQGHGPGVHELGPGATYDDFMRAAPLRGDYLWGSSRIAFLEAGAWGLVRVV